MFRHDEPRLEIVEAGRPWSFDGDGATFRLVSEANRIRLAHLFDPVLAVHTSEVEPLPHQITAVYQRATSYHRWLFAQGLLPDETARHWYGGSEMSWPDGWLVAEHALHGRRSDHRTTVKATCGMTPQGAPQLADREFAFRPNTSDSSGAIVRSAPAGILVPPDQAFETGAWTAAFSHGGPLGLFLPGVVARMVSELVAGATLASALTRGGSDLEGWPHHARALDLIDRTVTGVPGGAHEAGAARAFRVGVQMALGFEETGGDWANHAVATAVDPLIGTAVSDGGSAAIVAGQLIGARFGSTVFPAGWRHAIDLAPVIDEMADACALAHRIFVLDRSVPELGPAPDHPFAGHPASEFLWSRFPGW